MKGGKRPGAGRKRGSKNTRTSELARKAAAEGITPLEYMLQRMRDETAEPAHRDDMAKAAAPYIHPKLANIEHTGKNGGAIQLHFTSGDAGVL
jgi:hypothetical protein